MQSTAICALLTHFCNWKGKNIIPVPILFNLFFVHKIHSHIQDLKQNVHCVHLWLNHFLIAIESLSPFCPHMYILAFLLTNMVIFFFVGYYEHDVYASWDTSCFTSLTVVHTVPNVPETSPCVPSVHNSLICFPQQYQAQWRLHLPCSLYNGQSRQHYSHFLNTLGCHITVTSTILPAKFNLVCLFILPLLLKQLISSAICLSLLASFP